MWVVVVLGSLFVLTALTLSVPLDMAVRIEVYGRPKFKVRLGWLFGLINKEMVTGKKKAEDEKGAEDEPKPEVPEREIEGTPKRRKRRVSARTIFEIIRTKGLLRQTIGLLKGILGCFKIKDLVASFRVGLDNPADTGLLFALVGPVNFLLSSRFPHAVKLQPSFSDEAVLEGYLSGTVALRPIRLVPPFLKYIFSLMMLSVLWKLVLTKWKRKN